jgi:hypothetical protein
MLTAFAFFILECTQTREDTGQSLPHAFEPYALSNHVFPHQSIATSLRINWFHASILFREHGSYI